VGKGFVLGSGDPATAKLAICLEAPGNEELGFTILPPVGFSPRRFLNTTEDGKRELELRRRDYPQLEEKWLRTGAPVVGMSGHQLFDWILKSTRREDVFIDNVLRCLPPKRANSDEHYPKGDERKQSEACCRQWDRFAAMKPDVAVVSLHPASLLRDTTPLELQAKDFQKARDFVSQGHAVVVLAGGKSAKLWLGARENTTFWRGDYALLSDGLPRVKFARADEVKKGKKAKAPKLTPEEKKVRVAEKRAEKKRGKRGFLKGSLLDLGGGE
jgi:uracil-DNA glycosylase